MIRSVNPARRELRIVPHPRYEAVFEALHWLHVAWPDGRRLRCKVDALRAGSGTVIVALAAGVARDTVAQMRRARVVVPPEAVPAELPWHSTDLFELRAETEAGEALGQVVEIIETPGNDVLVLEDLAGRRLLLPVIPQVVRAVDMEAGVITLAELEAHGVVEGAGEDEAPRHED